MMVESGKADGGNNENNVSPSLSRHRLLARPLLAFIAVVDTRRLKKFRYHPVVMIATADFDANGNA